MIEIQDIENKSLQDIIDLLLDQKRQPFIIYVPKNTQQGFNNLQDITDDYATIAYCGELMNKVADKFSFTKISPQEHKSVKFLIETNKIEELAQTLLNISKGFNNIQDGEEGLFDEDMRQFLQDIEKKKTTPVCNYYFLTFLEYKELNKNSPKED